MPTQKKVKQGSTSVDHYGNERWEAGLRSPNTNRASSERRVVVGLFSPVPITFLHRTSEELTRTITTVGIRDDWIHGIAALVCDGKLRGERVPWVEPRQRPDHDVGRYSWSNTHHMSGRSKTTQDCEGDQIFEEHRVGSVVRWLENLMGRSQGPYESGCTFISPWERSSRITVICLTNNHEARGEENRSYIQYNMSQQ